MKNQTLGDLCRHLIATLVGLPSTIGLFALIPLISAVTYHSPPIAPIMVVDLVEIPKAKPVETKAEPKLLSEPPAKVQPQPSPVVLEKKLKVNKKKMVKTADQLSLKTAPEPDPQAAVETISKTVQPVTEDAPDSVSEPVPTPIFKLSTMPRFIHREMPVFPEKMKTFGRSATVKLKALIDKDGNVRKVMVVESAGPEFDQAAITALEKSSFFPGMLEDRPVAVMLRLPVIFRLL
ncbi:MAG: TonB family protein [Pseudomonadota bacterium]